MNRISMGGILLGLLVSVFLMPSCGGESSQREEGQIAIALVTDVGGVNDQSFNQSAWEGLTRAGTDFNIDASYRESNQNADYGPNIENLMDSDNDLIWGIGFMMGDVILESARNNPNQRFAIIDYAYDETPANLIGVVFQAEQASFLVGYIAGRMSQTGTVGFVGGIEGFIIDGFDYGFHAGVRYANAEVQVLRQYAESFTDAARGKAIALGMYQQGADIVFHAAGGVGDGVIEAAVEQNRWAIGVDRDQSELAPDNVLTSAMKRVDNAIYNVAQGLVAGVWAGGSTVVYGLAEGGVDIAPTSDRHVPADILTEVEALKARIIAGEIAVPFNRESFEAFVAGL